MIETVTHVAGPVVVFKKFHRAIQRCIVCGEKLCDSLGQVSPLGPDGKPAEFTHWTPGVMVQVSVGTNPTEYIVTGEFGKTDFPDDFCLELVE